VSLWVGRRGGEGEQGRRHELVDRANVVVLLLLLLVHVCSKFACDMWEASGWQGCAKKQASKHARTYSRPGSKDSEGGSPDNAKYRAMKKSQS
jgi:hypothetical protein